MKLSRALLIVLLLHVVAVSGIIAFNAIKTRESSFVPASSTTAEPKPSATVDAAIHTDGAKPQTAAAQKETRPRRSETFTFAFETIFQKTTTERALRR